MYISLCTSAMPYFKICPNGAAFLQRDAWRLTHTFYTIIWKTTEFHSSIGWVSLQDTVLDKQVAQLQNHLSLKVLILQDLLDFLDNADPSPAKCRMRCMSLFDPGLPQIWKSRDGKTVPLQIFLDYKSHQPWPLDYADWGWLGAGIQPHLESHRCSIFNPMN